MKLFLDDGVLDVKIEVKYRRSKSKKKLIIGVSLFHLLGQENYPMVIFGPDIEIFIAFSHKHLSQI